MAPRDNMSRKISRLIERDGTKCHYCGKEMNFTNPTSGRFRTVDHKIPKSQGGTKQIDNLILACWGCNHAKGDKDYITYTAMTKHRKGNHETN